MFFRISSEYKKIHPIIDQNTVNINGYVLQSDLGWHFLDNTIYKGYCLNEDIHTKVANKDYSETTGNYTIITFEKDSCKIYYDDSRSYCIYYDENQVTNLPSSDLHAVWFDNEIVCENKKWKHVYDSKKTIQFDAQRPRLTQSQIVDFVCEYLVNTAKNLTTDLPIYLAYSQGVDTTTIKSAFDYVGIPYKKVVANTKQNINELGWGYNVLYITDESHMQLSGYCGDEVFLRNPLYCQWLLDPFDVNLDEEYKKYDYSYMKGFYLHRYQNKIKNRNVHFRTTEQAYNHTANVLVNDYQMWHLNNTLTFTPYRNKELIETLLYADPDAILKQVIHGDLSKEVIRRLCPANLENILEHKNDYSCHGKIR